MSPLYSLCSFLTCWACGFIFHMITLYHIIHLMSHGFTWVQCAVSGHNMVTRIFTCFSTWWYIIHIINVKCMWFFFFHKGVLYFKKSRKERWLGWGKYKVQYPVSLEEKERSSLLHVFSLYSRFHLPPFHPHLHYPLLHQADLKS